MLKEGDDVPDITLEGLKGKINLREEAEKGIVVIYFYPKDHTSGCTAEAKSFRDLMPEFQKLGVKIFGISKDSIKSHRSFSEKHKLNFELLSDPEAVAIEAFGVKNEKSKRGSAKRVTFIAGRGKILHLFPKVKPMEHAEEVLRKLGEILKS